MRAGLTENDARLGKIAVRLFDRAILAIGHVILGAGLQVAGNFELRCHVRHASLVGGWVEGQELVASAHDIRVTNTEGQERRDEIREGADAVQEDPEMWKLVGTGEDTTEDEA